MDDLEFLKTHVPKFEGYDDEIARHHTDQRIRAWVGSMLADIQAERESQLDPETQKALEAAVLRCQFPDQVFTTRLDVAHVDLQLEQSLAQVDRKIVELGERARTASPAELSSILGELSATFDQRRQRAPAPPTVA
jgi:hypothetical protein